MSRSLVVTIDGPAGAGKSTVARTLAARLGYRLLDTGAIYRAVAVMAMRAGVDLEDAERLATIAAGLEVDFELIDDVNRVRVGGDDVTAAIRTPEASQAASRVSRHGPVRSALLELQRRLGGEGGVVVEGRDTGTVVFPSAEAKFYLTASDAVRTQRRRDELAAKGQQVGFEDTLKEIQERDRRDASRDVAPMKPADDAVEVDSSGLTMEEVVAVMEAEVRRRL